MIADRRELYNDQVYRYNTRIAQVPTSALAAILGWRPRRVLRAGAGATTRPDVSLDTDDPPTRIRRGSDGMTEPRRPSSGRSGWSATARPSGRASAGIPAGPTSR